MATSPEIQDLIDNFVASLTAAIQEQTIAALEHALGGSIEPARRGRAGGAARGRPASRGSRAKGAKRSPEELEELTSRLAAYVKSNPGQRIEQIAAEMGVSTKELNLPAKKLLADRVLKTKGQKRATQYFPK